ncbi:hypothetical protein SeLEV6574_g03489 [Synchytrium endobioticum]|uniref:Uncharacterized protein n=1 Tax=Synchytrium endobioticum TaxID=286115 RepID=A0A507D457_9FUNG|nr:hypothetical protein SeLEV6574_g03489 [Synchytrium endobioticum]
MRSTTPCRRSTRLPKTPTNGTHPTPDTEHMVRREFPLFPFRLFRVNPPFLDKSLPDNHYDPWRKRDAWRRHDFFSARNRFLHMVPGLGIATVAFAAYLAYDIWDSTNGAKAQEKEKWSEWMKERDARLHGRATHH